jgi:hypothetical protein
MNGCLLLVLMPIVLPDGWSALVRARSSQPQWPACTPAWSASNTWVSATDRGRWAFAGHLTELQRLAAQSPPPEDSDPR